MSPSEKAIKEYRSYIRRIIKLMASDINEILMPLIVRNKSDYMMEPEERTRFGLKNEGSDTTAENSSASQRQGQAVSFHSHRVYQIHEMQRYMRERFLHGQETNVDYERIDRDDSVDDFEMLNQDGEDAYFS